MLKPHETSMQISTQTDNHKLRKNVAIDKKYILRKRGLKFLNPKFNILSKIEFYFSYKI